MNTVERTLEYWEARFEPDNGQTLEKLIRKAWGKFADHVERTVDIGDNRSYSGLRSSDSLYKGFAIHCGRFTDNQAIGTISRTPSKDAEVGELPPPNDKNFLDFDLMAYICENRIICLNCGPKASRLILYLSELFKKANMSGEVSGFTMNRVNKFDKIRLMKKHGIKRMDIDVSFSDIQAKRLKNFDPSQEPSRARAIKHAVLDTLRCLNVKYKSDEDLRKEEDQKEEKGSFRVSIDLLGRKVQTTREGFIDFASKIVTDDDELESYTIHLMDGGKIKSNEIAVKKKIKIQPKAKSVSVHDAWDEMSTYMTELETEELRVERSI